MPDTEELSLGGLFYHPSGVIYVSAFDANEVVVYRTDDNGSTWTNVAAQLSGYVVNRVNFVNAELGFLTTRSPEIQSPSVLFRTVNGGLDWIPVAWSDSMFIDVKFVDENVGYAITKNGEILKSVDGGANWALDHQEDQPIRLNAIEVSNGSIYVFGEMPYFLKNDIFASIRSTEPYTLSNAFPNPARPGDIVTVEHLGLYVSDVLMIDAAGRKVASQRGSVMSDRTTVHLPEDLYPGVYNLALGTSDGRLFARLLVID